MFISRFYLTPFRRRIDVNLTCKGCRSMSGVVDVVLSDSTSRFRQFECVQNEKRLHNR